MRCCIPSCSWWESHASYVGLVFSILSLFLVHLHGLGSIDVSTRIANSNLECVLVHSFLSLHVSVLFSFTYHLASLCTFPLVDSKRNSSR